MTSPRKLLSTTILLAGMALVCGCSKDAPAPSASSSAAPASAKPTGKLSSDECQKLSEHILDLSVAGTTEADKKKAVEELKKEIKNDPLTKKCESEFTRARYDCMMKAKTDKAITACEATE
jgi:hypothetical protein